jgi:hypothetical protein
LNTLTEFLDKLVTEGEVDFRGVESFSVELIRCLVILQLLILNRDIVKCNNKSRKEKRRLRLDRLIKYFLQYPKRLLRTFHCRLVFSLLTENRANI